MHIKETHQFQGILRAVFTVSLRDIIHELLLIAEKEHAT